MQLIIIEDHSNYGRHYRSRGQGRSPSCTWGGLGYPKKKVIVELVDMYLYLASSNNKH